MSAVGAPIVVLDDDEDTVDALVTCLQQAGYPVEGYTKPQAALTRLRLPPAPSLFIIDHHLEATSGVDVVRDIRAAGLDTPVVFLTGVQSTHIDHAALLDLGVKEVLTKPAGLDEIVRMIERVGVTRGDGQGA